ncbi:MAG: ABC transporter permease, partial [Terriglobales bacterium]
QPLWVKLGRGGWLGRQVTVDGGQYTVVGIMSRDFARNVYDAGAWIPMVLTPAQLSFDHRTAKSFNVIGRLRPEATVAEAAAEVRGISHRHAKEEKNWSESAMTLEQYNQLRFDAYSLDAFQESLGALLLLIACGCVACLLFERGAVRAPEMATRQALGAGRGRIVRQLLAESLMLAALAAPLGLLLGWAGMKALAITVYGSAGPGYLRFRPEIMAFTLAVAMLTAALAGMAPAWQTSRWQLLPRGLAAAARGRQRWRSGLMVGVVAFGLACLITSTALSLDTLHDLRAPVGWQPEGLAAASLTLAGPAYQSPERMAQALARLQNSLAALPGITDAALVSPPPVGWDGTGVEGKNGKVLRIGLDVLPRILNISPGYFAALRLSLESGRRFTSADRIGAPPVVIVNRAAAQILFPGARSAVGQYIHIERRVEPAWREIVGEVANAAQYPGDSAQYEAAIYVPLEQAPRPQIGLLLRGPGGLGALLPEARRALRQLDPALPLYAGGSVQDLMLATYGGGRYMPQVTAVLNGVVLLLVAMGLYGVV